LDPWCYYYWLGSYLRRTRKGKNERFAELAIINNAAVTQESSHASYSNTVDAKWQS
jgi:hypothetical protein